MPRKFKFTGASLARLEPAEKQYRVWDAARQGLGLRVSPGGRKTFFFLKRVKGRDVLKTLGSIQEISLDRARSMAEDLTTQLAGPGSFKVGKTDWKTVEELLNLYDADGARKGLKANDERTAETRRAFGPLVHRTVDQITKNDIKDQLDTIEEEVSQGRARKQQTHLSGFYRWAMYDDLVPYNFMPEIRPRKGYGERQRYLSPDEIGIVWVAASFLSPAFRDCARMLLITGQRRSEVAEAPKQEVDLRQAVWTISKDRVKNNRDHDVPLGPVGREILAGRMQVDQSEFLFSSDGKVPINGFSKTLPRLNDFAEKVRVAFNETVADIDHVPPLRHFTFHDLRRTLGTQWIELIGATSDEVFIQHNHTKQGVQKNYQYETVLKRRRELTEKWEEEILRVSEPFKKTSLVFKRD
jgi:integrase